MNKLTPFPTARSSRSLFYLCQVLFFLAVILMGLGIFYFVRGVALAGGFFLLVAGVMAAAGVGIYRLRRWGVLLFGALSLALSLNHIILVFNRYTRLPAGVLPLLGALVDLLLAFLIPLALFYLTLKLWKRCR